MPTVAKVLLIAIFPLLLLARAINVLLGRDPLGLRHPEPGDSCWIARRSQPNVQSYFSEASDERDSRPSAAHWIVAIFRTIARLYRPGRTTQHTVHRNLLTRDQRIPDEIYTLW